MSKLSHLSHLKYTGRKNAVRMLKAVADMNTTKGMEVTYTVDSGFFRSQITLFGNPKHVVETTLEAMNVLSGSGDFTRRDIETVLDLCFTEGTVRA